MTSSNTFLDPRHWRAPNNSEIRSYITSLTREDSLNVKLESVQDEESRRRSSLIDLTMDFESIDLFCFLKARFGAPNGLTMAMRHGGTDDLYHWEYVLCASSVFIGIHSTQMGIESWFHGVTQLRATDIELFKRRLAESIREFRKEIDQVKNKLDHLSVFVNPYQRLNEVVQGLEAKASSLEIEFPNLKPMTAASGSWNEDDLEEFHRKLTDYGMRVSEAQTVGLSIKMIVPIWVESFVNLTFATLAKEEVRQNKRLFESYLRDQVDVRVLKLFDCCDGFDSRVSGHDDEVKNFNRLFNQRNQLLHGNIDIPNLTTEKLCFDGTVPLYGKWKSEFERRIAPRLHFIEPKIAHQDIVTGSEFIIYLLNKMSRESRSLMARVSDATLLGYHTDSRRIDTVLSDNFRVLIPLVRRSGESPPPRKRSLAECEPPDYASCPCGSGASFGDCCKEGYKTASHAVVSDLTSRCQHDEALAACRRFLCWYVLCHQAHTRPFLPAQPGSAVDELLSVDIEALGDCIEMLRDCCRAAGKADNFPTAVDSLDPLIDDPRWRRKLKYHLAVFWMYETDQEKAKDALSEIDISECSDVDVLTLFLDVCSDDMAMQMRTNIASRICDLTGNETDRFQYTCLIGVMHYEREEFDSAIDVISRAVSEFSGISDEEKTEYGLLLYARSLKLLGEMTDNSQTIRDSIHQFESLQTDAPPGRYKPAFFAECMKSIAECKVRLKEYEEAIEYFRKSIEITSSSITYVLLGKALAKSGNIAEAKATFSRVDCADLCDPEYYDFAVGMTELAMVSKDVCDIEAALLHWNVPKCSTPVSRSERDRAVISLLKLENELLRQPS